MNEVITTLQESIKAALLAHMTEPQVMVVHKISDSPSTLALKEAMALVDIAAEKALAEESKKRVSGSADREQLELAAKADTLARCKICKHWNVVDKYVTGASLGLGRCEATLMFWESTKWSDDGDSRCWTDEAKNTTAYVQDASDYSATLYTKAEHGCTMYEQA